MTATSRGARGPKYLSAVGLDTLFRAASPGPRPSRSRLGSHLSGSWVSGLRFRSRWPDHAPFSGARSRFAMGHLRAPPFLSVGPGRLRSRPPFLPAPGPRRVSGSRPPPPRPTLPGSPVADWTGGPSRLRRPAFGLIGRGPPGGCAPPRLVVPCGCPGVVRPSCLLWAALPAPRGRAP